jgi:hypothetical protein
MPWNLGLVWDPISCLAPFSVTNPTGVNAWRHAIWDGTRYIVLDADWLGVSTNRGKDWTFEPISGITNPHCVASNGSRIVTCEVGGTEEIFTSDNGGASWTSRATLSGFTFPDIFNIGEIMSIVSDGSGFVLCGRSSSESGNNVYYSVNGTTWIGVHVGPLSSNVYFSAVKHMNGAYYMAGTELGTLLLSKSVTGGATWVTLTPPPAAAVVDWPFLWTLNGQLIMKTREVSDLEPMRLWTSSDEGANWTEITTGIYDIVLLDWTGSEWVAVTDDGYVMRGATLSSLSTSPTVGDSLILAASNTNFIIESINSPTGSIRVIDPDCDNPVPYIWYNLFQHTVGDDLPNSAISGDDIWDLLVWGPGPPLDQYISWDRPFPSSVPYTGRRPYYPEDYGGVGFSTGVPISVVWVTTGDLFDDSAFALPYVGTDANISDTPGEFSFVESVLWAEEDWLSLQFQLSNSQNTYDRELFVDINRSYLSVGRNVFSITLYPNGTSADNYVCINEYNSIDNPEILDFVVTSSVGIASSDFMQGPFPAEESYVKLEIGVYTTLQHDVSTAFVRKAITLDDIDFWMNVDLANHPGF